MKKYFFLLPLLLFSTFSISQSFIISGKISDLENGEYLPLATIYCIQIAGGSATNDYGFYSIKVPKGQNTLEFSYVGYAKQLLNIHLNGDSVINILLKPVIEMDEVTVVAEGILSRLQSTKISTHTITAKELDALPSLLGETDIIKELRALPGVNSGGEGSAGLIVRGSGPDQNLVLFDGVPIYNINHLSGFFSVFNTDAIASAEIYKGAYPARYGGRISSVIDVRMREGNLNKIEGKISIGTVASKLTLEGPLIKNKASFILSARRTYLDLLSYPIQRALDPYDVTKYSFDDYNIKLNYILNQKNRFYISGYKGKDKFSIESKYNEYSKSERLEYMDWGNAFISSRWNHTVGSKTFLNVTAYIYQYKYDAGDNSYSKAFELDSIYGIKNINNEIIMRDYSVKADFDYNLNQNHKFKYGGQYIYHKFYPNTYTHYEINPDDGSMNPKADTTDIYKSLGSIESNEIDVYVEDEITVSERVKINVGVHYSTFFYISERFQFLMPRLSLLYMPKEELSLKIASGMYNQYSFLLSNPSIGLPTDTWLQSVNGLKPMVGWQTVMGVMYYTHNEWLFNLETYYKTTSNVIEYKEMQYFDVFEKWQDILSQGKAKNYGVEFMVEKRSYKYMLKASYAYTRSKMYFNDLNQGNPYYYTFDSPININIESNIKINKKIDIGMSWTYASGKLLTLVEQDYTSYIYYEDMQNFYNYARFATFTKGETLHVASERNNHRVPNYHRLDLCINLKKEKPRGTRVWSFGLYNAYNRKNTFYLEYWGGSYKNQSLTPIIPYASYSFKF